MNASTLLARAMSGLNKGTVYVSPGKMPSFDAVAWPEHAENDCSGFVDWCLRFSADRKVDHPLYKRINGGWFETTAIYADGNASVGFFSQSSDGKPGSLLVYPDYVGANGKHHDGHIGIVLEANGPGIAGITKIIHCSLGGYRTKGDAVQITDSKIWQGHANSILVDFDGLDA